MIPVTEQDEPESFDKAVRKKGEKWLKKNKFTLSKPLPKGTEPPPHWRACLGDLHSEYDGVCAYLCIYIERAVAPPTVDHFVAKSKHAGLIYEWSNYRLACASMNTRKNSFSDVLDPFKLAADTFRLNLLTGQIYPRRGLKPPLQQKARLTIERLDLDGEIFRELRAGRFEDYINFRTEGARVSAEAHLKRYSPFVWLEAKRQKKL